MEKDTLVSVSDQGFQDHLSEMLQEGARKLIATAVASELEEFLAVHRERNDAEGRRAVVRNGYQPERALLTGVGEVPVRMPKARDRSGAGIVFRSALVPPYLKRTRRIEEVIPALYLAGISSNDFPSALTALFGERVEGLSTNTIARLKRCWEKEYEEFRDKSWAGKRFVYVWADGIYINVRAAERRCVLVVIGCDEAGEKHFLAIEEGFRESKRSWRALLERLKTNGVEIAPKLAVGDGALGFWAALAEVWPATRTQRCWVHKTANVLNKLPKSVHAEAKAGLHEIWMAPDRKTAETAFDRFLAAWGEKYPKAAACLARDRDALLAFYDFPGAHWQHIRTTNPIESSFATIRLRADTTRNCVSAKSGLALVYKLAMSAQQRWRRLRGFKQLAKVIDGVKFTNGVDVVAESESGRKAA
jgi:transposase-like protein